MLDLENYLKNETKVLFNRAVLKKYQVTPNNLPLPLEILKFLVLRKPQSIPAIIFSQSTALML